MKNARRARLRELASVPIAAVAVAALAVAGWLFAQSELAALRAEHATLSAEHAAMSVRAARIAELRREADRSLAAYSRLVARGVIGGERRVAWLEFMTRLKSERRVHRVKYAIEPQRVLALPSADAGIAEIELRASRAELDLQAGHEGDLLGFLAGLHDVPGAWLVPRTCMLRRVSAAEAEVGAAPRLHALCSFDFVTLHDRRAEAIAR